MPVCYHVGSKPGDIPSLTSPSHSGIDNWTQYLMDPQVLNVNSSLVEDIQSDVWCLARQFYGYPLSENNINK